MTDRLPLLTDELLEAMIARRSSRATAPDLRATLGRTVVLQPQRGTWRPALAWRRPAAVRTAVALLVVAALLTLLALVAAGLPKRPTIEATRLIAYSRFNAVYVLDVPTRVETKLLDTDRVSLLGWAKDGRHLLLGDGRILALDGSTDSALADRVPEGGSGLLSPDGAALATWGDKPGSAFVIVTRDGATRRLPLPDLGGIVPDQAPVGWERETAVWSPDGRRLAVLANTSCSGGCADKEPKALGFEVYTVPIDGSPVARVARLPEAFVRGGMQPFMTWSPDGTTLAVATNDACVEGAACGPGRSHIAMVGLDGTVSHTFDLPGSTWCCGVAWSPDGARLAIGGDAPVTIVPRDGGKPLTVGRGQNAVSWQAWSPDGRSIAYGVSDDLSGIASAEGGPPMLLPFGTDLSVGWGGFGGGPAWQPAPAPLVTP